MTQLQAIMARRAASSSQTDQDTATVDMVSISGSTEYHGLALQTAFHEEWGPLGVQ